MFQSTMIAYAQGYYVSVMAVVERIWNFRMGDNCKNHYYIAQYVSERF